MADPQPPRVEMFSRAAVTGGQTRQREVIDRLHDLESEGRITGVSVHSWEGRVRVPTDEDPSAGAVEWFERFEQWADEHDADLAPAFERHRHTSELAEEEFEEFVFPVLAVAVVRDGRIERVAPRVEDEPVTVADCIDRLADDAPRPEATVPAE